MVAESLPKYVREANSIIDLLSKQPDRTWSRTQRELAEELHLTQPILSMRLRQLEEHGKILRSDPLPMRGRNFAIELIDETPFVGPLQAVKPRRHKDDRALSEEEVVLPPVIELGQFTPEKIGIAILQTLHDFWEREERALRKERQLQHAAETFRDHLAQEHRATQALLREKSELEKKLKDTEELATYLRKQINEMIIANGKGGKGSHHKMTEVLSQEDQQLLKNLMSA